MNVMEKDRRYREYLTNKINPIIEPLIKQLLRNQPEDIHEYIINFVKKHKEDPNSVITPSRFDSSSKTSSKPAEPSKSDQSSPQKAQKKAPAPETPPGSDSESEDEEVEEVPLAELQQKRGRTSVSAEAYGKFNQKGNFTPRVIKKTADQKKRIIERLTKAFMFATLDGREQQIIIDAMEEKKYKTGEWVIKQGDDGDNLYVIDSGTLECYKQFDKHSEPQHVKTYNPGESFGELALLYNAPRAASIKAVSECILFALDRDTFNNIVKDAIIKRREKFEQILSKIELLDTMDPYERSKIADVAIPIRHKAGEFVIKQGEQGDRFYFIEDGTAVATKTLPGRKEPEVVYNYGPGEYFGELALLKGEARAANVMAKSDLSLLALDRIAFDRVLGPLTDILKRNAKKYEKFM